MSDLNIEVMAKPDEETFVRLGTYLLDEYAYSKANITDEKEFQYTLIEDIVSHLSSFIKIGIQVVDEDITKRHPGLFVKDNINNVAFAMYEDVDVSFSYVIILKSTEWNFSKLKDKLANLAIGDSPFPSVPLNTKINEEPSKEERVWKLLKYGLDGEEELKDVFIVVDDQFDYASSVMANLEDDVDFTLHISKYKFNILTETKGYGIVTRCYFYGNKYPDAHLTLENFIQKCFYNTNDMYETRILYDTDYKTLESTYVSCEIIASADLYVLDMIINVQVCYSFNTYGDENDGDKYYNILINKKEI